MELTQLNLKDSLIGLKNRQFSCTDLITAYLNRISIIDPIIHAYLTLNPHALNEAQLIDKQLTKSTDQFTKYPLLGIPIAIKDNFLTENIRTTASSKLLDNFIPACSATVVSKLKQVGAIILGKTNMDSWAHGSSTETSDYGVTKNPWNLNHLPGGSSGGSAAAVSADECVFAIGSETAGSIRQPSAWCGVTGLKPTYGRVSRNGVIAMASSTDSPGPIAKNVYDAAYILNLIAGKDQYDATTIPAPFNINLNTLSLNMTGIKIGIPAEYILKQMDKRVIKLIYQAGDIFTSLGAIVSTTNLLDPKYAIGVYTIIQRSEVSSNLARFDGIRYGRDRSFFNQEAKKRIMLGTYSLTSGYYDQYYQKAQKVRTLIVADFNRAFSKYDLILGPVSPGPALKLGATKNEPMFGEMQDILLEASSIAGLPGLAVPCGFVDDLPIGLQITGPQQAEERVVQAGLAYQHITNWHLCKPKL